MPQINIFGEAVGSQELDCLSVRAKLIIDSETVIAPGLIRFGPLSGKVDINFSFRQQTKRLKNAKTALEPDGFGATRMLVCEAEL